MTVKSHCAHCGKPLPTNLKADICPACELAGALDHEELPTHVSVEVTGGSVTGFDTIQASVLTEVRQFGDYELIEEIARGGMGVVFKARQKSLDRLVAVKMILGGLATKEFIQRFHTEASTAASLQHPNIVAIHEVGVHAGEHFLAMDFVDGPNLARLVGQQPLAGRVAARYLKAIAEAVQFAHDRHILHRDLKPANILIDSNDQPRVTDFGLAKRLEAETDLTLSGQVLGSPNYMPPEQATPKQGSVGKHSDIYSLGAILYHLLTGRPPFQGQTITEVLLQVGQTEPISPRLLNPGVSRDLETICLKCLEKEPAKRYRSARDLADDLGRFLNDETIFARPVSRPERAWRWCRRRPALSALIVVASLSILVTAIVSAIAAARLAAGRRAEQREAYYVSVTSADQYIREGDVDRAKDLLLKCPPEFRHWEWGRLLYLCHQEVAIFQAHSNSLTSVSVSADPRRFATLGTNGVLKVWDWDQDRELFATSSETRRFTSHAISPNGEHLAVAASDGLVQIHETRTWREVSQWRASTSLVSVAYSPDGRRLAGAATDRAVTIWDATTGERAGSLPASPSPIEQLFFSPDGTRLIMKEALAARVWDAATHQELQSFTASPERHRAFFVDPTGRRFVTIDAQDRVAVWSDATNSREFGRIIGNKSLLDWRVFFSADGRLLCTPGEPGSARVYETATGREVATLTERVYDAAFTRDGRRLITAGAKNVATIWDLARARPLRTLHGHGTLIDHVAFTSDERLAITADREGGVRVWAATDGREVFERGTWVHGSSVSGDGKLLAICPSSQHAEVWNTEMGARQSLLPRPALSPFQSSFSPDNKFVAIAGTERRIRIFDVKSGQETLALSGHTRHPLYVVYSPDGTRLASTDRGGQIQIWNSISGAKLQTIESSSLPVWKLCFSQDGTKLLTSVGTAMPLQAVLLEAQPGVWEVSTGRLLYRLDHPAPVWAQQMFTPDGLHIVGGSVDRKIRIWDARTGALLATHAARSFTEPFSISPDGRRLLVNLSERGEFGYSTPLLEIWDLEAGRGLISLRGHTENGTSGHFTRDGQRILTTSHDLSARQFETFPWTTEAYAKLGGQNPGAASRNERGPSAGAVQNYARQYWRDRLVAEEIGQRRTSEADQPPASRAPRSSWPKRPADAPPNTIDLTEHYLTVLDAQIHPNDGPNWDDDLGALLPGVATLAGVPFDIRGVVTLRRVDPRGGPWQKSWEITPSAIKGIAIGRKLQRLHALHGACFGLVPDGTMIGSYVWHFADGTRHESEIVYGRDLRDWWQRPGEKLSATDRAVVVWTGANPAATATGASLRLYLRTYANPKPDTEVTSIDFVSSMTTAAPFLVALTAEP